MMAVGSVTTGNCFHVAGIRLAAIAANIRYQERLDLVLIEIADGSTVSGVFTQNAFCAAPVTVARNHLAKRSIRFFLINTGNANAGTGKAGEADALSCCREIAALAGNRAWEVLPFSTGIIGEKLPVERIMKNVPNVFHKLTDSNWEAAAQGIFLRSYGGKNPRQEYKREAFALFTDLMINLQQEVIKVLSHVQVRQEDAADTIERQREQEKARARVNYQHQAVSALSSNTEEVGQKGRKAGQQRASQEAEEQRQTPFVREVPKVGRNEPCPCGSGKKYKICHGKLE